MRVLLSIVMRFIVLRFHLWTSCTGAFSAQAANNARFETDAYKAPLQLSLGVSV